MSFHIPTSLHTQQLILKERRKATLLSFLISVLVLFLLGAVQAFSFIYSNEKDYTNPTVYSYLEEVDTPDPEPRLMNTSEQVSHTSPSSAFLPANVISPPIDSSVSLPVSESRSKIESVEFFYEEGFGPDVGFEEFGSAETSFFRSKIKGRNICYVMDYSASMRGVRDRLMRKELKKSVKKLKGGAQYNLIFFSGPVWQAGDKVILENDKRSGTVSTLQVKVIHGK